METEVSHFGVDDITVTLSWPQQEHSVNYSISVGLQMTLRLTSGSTIVQLTLSYNTRYTVTIVGTLCGRNISTTDVELNYGELVLDATVVLIKFCNACSEVQKFVWSTSIS